MLEEYEKNDVYSQPRPGSARLAGRMGWHHMAGRCVPCWLAGTAPRHHSHGTKGSGYHGDRWLVAVTMAIDESQFPEHPKTPEPSMEEPRADGKRWGSPGLAVQLHPSYPIQALDGHPFGSGQVEYQTKPILLQVGVNHSETLSFLLITAPENPLILGYPWLLLYNPLFSWSMGHLLDWGKNCQTNCLRPPPRASPQSPASLEDQDFSTLPPEYFDLQEVLWRGAVMLGVTLLQPEPCSHRENQLWH
ncbi:hypothetical protein J4Q44_G00209570 [Coregonus suidteri]|uniref:Uncharacterized protein n=1 Tax=Coregonus suidteri TaxID=861788 RepID=A0AAN8QQ27_9TELE